MASWVFHGQPGTRSGSAGSKFGGSSYSAIVLKNGLLTAREVFEPKLQGFAAPK